MSEFDGTVAVVTGGGSGIGAAVVQAFVRAGAEVALCGRRRERLAAVVAALGPDGARAHPYPLDVADGRAIADTVARIAAERGPLSFLVNNAGISGFAPLGAEDDDPWHDVLATNLTGPYLVTRAWYRHRAPAGRRAVVNVASVLGRFGVPGYAAYCTSKHGLIGLTRVHALELAREGITVNAVCPGWVDTDMARDGWRGIGRALGKDEDAGRAFAMKGVPIGRALDPAEIAALIRYLCSDAAAGMTGQSVVLDGGQVMP